MLTAPVLQRRIAHRICAIGDVHLRRPWSGSREVSYTPRNSTPLRRNGRKQEQQKQKTKVEEEEQDANLYEQLFGASSTATEEPQVEEWEVPLIPLEPLTTDSQPSKQLEYQRRTHTRDYQRVLDRLEMEHNQNQPQISVLVMRNASKHLVEEDFKRLIPQGSHLEGWTLDQGDIIKVIPGRDPETLEQSNFYYLLFSSALSAFTYQGRAIRVHKVVASHTPSSILSPMMPPPGITAQKLDANAAIQSFSLIAPNEALDLRQLKRPLTPVMQTIVRNRGYPWLISRKNRMPYEARLTLEGPQVHESAIRHFFRKDGRQRGLSWSGGDRAAPEVTKWNLADAKTAHGVIPAAMSRKNLAQKWGRRQERSEIRAAEERDAQANEDDINREYATRIEFDQIDARQHKEGPVEDKDVFIIGFATERAMQSFVHFWHRRPMVTEGFEHDRRTDTPPVINVEALW